MCQLPFDACLGKMARLLFVSQVAEDRYRLRSLSQWSKPRTATKNPHGAQVGYPQGYGV